jgi:hypothetical protein
MTQDRPSAALLVTAVREFLERDVMPATEGRVQFHTRVAINVLNIVARELELGDGFAERERERAAALLGHGGTVDDLERELASRSGRAHSTTGRTRSASTSGRPCARSC